MIFQEVSDDLGQVFESQTLDAANLAKPELQGSGKGRSFSVLREDRETCFESKTSRSPAHEKAFILIAPGRLTRCRDHRAWREPEPLEPLRSGIQLTILSLCSW